MARKRREPTPINGGTKVNPISSMGGGTNGDPPTSSPQDSSLTNTLWSELEDHHGEVEVNNIPAEYLTELRRRVRDGEIQTKMITGDDAEAADNWTRAEVGRLFIRYRRRVGKFKIREFVPVIHEHPTDRREWVRGSDRPDAAQRHAAAALTQGLDTSIRLHGAALVALGVADWSDVEDYAVRRVRQQCELGRDIQDLKIAR